MNLQQFLSFLPIALLLAIAPGPDNLGVLALGVSRGRRESLGFALGCASGCLNHTLLAALGISALIAASPIAFRALQYSGAAYLIWIGIKGLHSRGSRLDGAAPLAADTGFLPYFRRGLIANVINPKVILFFLAFLPQFVTAKGWSTPAQIAVLGLCFAVCAALILGLIALGANRVGTWLRGRERFALWLDRVTGGLFIGLGLKLAFSDLR